MRNDPTAIRRPSMSKTPQSSAGSHLSKSNNSTDGKELKTEATEIGKEMSISPPSRGGPLSSQYEYWSHEDDRKYSLSDSTVRGEGSLLRESGWDRRDTYR